MLPPKTEEATVQPVETEPLVAESTAPPTEPAIPEKPEEAEKAMYHLALDGTLSVYGGRGKLYDNYTLTIKGNIAVLDPENTDTSYESVAVITQAGPLHLNLPRGAYTFTVHDNANPADLRIFTVSIWDDGEPNLDMFSYFGGTPVRITISGISESGTVALETAVVSILKQDELVQTIRMEEAKKAVYRTYLLAGNYEAIIEAEGCITDRQSFKVTAGTAVNLDFIFRQMKLEKMLTKVIGYHEEEIYDWYTFNYDDQDRLSGIEDWIQDELYSVSTFTYDGTGNLKTSIEQVVSDGSYNDYMEYEYDASGRLIGWTKSGDMEAHTVRTYDENGRKLQDVTSWSWGTETEDYTYQNGILVKSVYTREDTSGSYVEETYYTVDAIGRVVRTEKPISDMRPFPDVARYWYDYKIFVISSGSLMGENTKCDVALTADNGFTLWNVFACGEYTQDEDGYLVRVTDEYETYVFLYDWEELVS